MTALLDTSVAVAVIRRRPNVARDRLRAAIAEGEAIYVSVIAIHELWYGVGCSDYPDETARAIRDFVGGGVVVLPFLEEDAVLAGALRAQLERTGTPIGPYDVLIAAQALRLDATLVTANTREFARVPGLVCEDWTRASDT